MKLCLGTVQFGQDYGIFGHKKPSLDYAIDCLDYATQNGIDAIDTAEAYGTALEVVGSFLAKKTIARDKLVISAKLPPKVLNNVAPEQYKSVIKAHLVDNLRVLGTDYVDSYIFHESAYVLNPAMVDALASMVQEGLTGKTGAAVYYPNEALECVENPKVTFTQLPYSVLDHRMKNAGVFEKAKTSNCEITARSVFVQGLTLTAANNTPEYLSEAKELLERLDKICDESGFRRVELALAYVKREPIITKLVFGIDTLEQLKEDIEIFYRDIPADVFDELDREFAVVREDIVVPTNWKG